MAIITSNSITFVDNSGAEKYLYIRYSNDGVTFTDNNGLTPGDWLGTCTSSSSVAPTDFGAYTWSKIKGENGGEAATYYTWIKYADDANGTNMSDDPDGKAYMGIAYNKETKQESEVASEYTWSLIQGSNGIDGDNGITYYTWVKYADNDDGDGMSDDPTGKEYIGIAYNQTNSEESNDPSQYTWMLFKGKDGIDGENGAAGKGIKSITEYYLISTNSTGITVNSSGWSTDVPTLDKVNKYLWNYESTEFTTGEIDTTEPVVIGVYGETGESGASLQIKYLSSATTPIVINNDVSSWLDAIPVPVEGENIYMVQKLSTDTDWSTPIQISANDGETPTMEIVNGYWHINGESTGVKAEGEDGSSPEITIGNNGNWFINGVDSGTKAQGETGRDGSDIEYVYYRSESEIDLPAPSYTDEVLSTGWTPSPQGITETYKCEYVSVRTKPSDGDWGEFSEPVLWSRWGEKGQDGDGVEYKYYLSNSSTAPVYSVEDGGWTDDPQGVSIDQQYEYVVQIKTSSGTSVVSAPSLWAKFGEDGTDGNGIVSIINYYAVTSEPVSPDEWIEEVPPAISNTYKYLWNYEKIIYTDESFVETEPAIIGVHGDNGENGIDAVDFQIYSVNGFEFNDVLTSIELKTAAFQGGTKIESGATYQWKMWVSNVEDDSNNYESIDGATEPTFVVNVGDDYAFTSLKCEMTYDGIVYEDYVSLTKKAPIYMATVKFFNGSNIIDSQSDYLIAYVELYRDNSEEEFPFTTNIYNSAHNSVQNGVITTDLTGDYTDGDMMYFICQNGDDYDVALGIYNSHQWEIFENHYVYKNDLFDQTTSNVFIIPKNKISRSLDVNIEVYKKVFDNNGAGVYNDETIVARTSVTAIDLNDPIIGDDEPIDPRVGQLWLNTSVHPSVLRIWDGDNWVDSGYQNGNTVYTSKPTDGYSAGDLWILAAGEEFGDFGPGSMLMASVTANEFNELHWKDAMEDVTSIITNVKESFAWNNNGIQVMKSVTDSNGNKTTPFYVSIDSTRMGFHSVTYDDNGKEIDNIEVVHVGNNSSVIQNATFEGSNGTTFKNNAIFQQTITLQKASNSGVVFQMEENGSFSLAILTE